MNFSKKLMHGLMSLAAIVLASTAYAKCSKLLDHTHARLQDSAPQSLCQHQGEVLVVVNTASFCGFTKQYEALESVYEKYKDRGLVVVGFPSNDFGQQEPGSEKEIADFCRLTYGIKFPMMAKTDILAPNTHPFYQGLIKQTGESPKWNFHKYVIDRTGTKVTSFDSKTVPDGPVMISQIERWLNEK